MNEEPAAVETDFGAHYVPTLEVSPMPLDITRTAEQPTRPASQLIAIPPL